MNNINFGLYIIDFTFFRGWGWGLAQPQPQPQPQPQINNIYLIFN
jgi:hypothetical protein